MSTIQSITHETIKEIRNIYRGYSADAIRSLLTYIPLNVEPVLHLNKLYIPLNGRMISVHLYNTLRLCHINPNDPLPLSNNAPKYIQRLSPYVSSELKETAQRLDALRIHFYVRIAPTIDPNPVGYRRGVKTNKYKEVI